MTSTPPATLSRKEILIYGILIALLIGVRFFHLGPYVDDPHSWRQCDTAHYILDFHQSGIDLMHPAVCWMGAHETVILEFPLPEAIAAVAYNLLGPELVWARWIFLLFFLGSAVYLFLLIRMLYGTRMGLTTLVLYMGLPLCQYYSRAIHVDFSAMFFALGGVYYLLKGFGEEKPLALAASIGMLTLGFLIKAPYVFYFALPVAWYLWKEGKLPRVLKWSPAFLLPLVAFWAWRTHATAVNGMAPDWDFIPGYLKMTEMGQWYFGDLSQRVSGYAWGVLGDRLWNDWAGWGALAFFLAGLGIAKTTGGIRITFLWLWGLGLFAYLLIFFNLNLKHDYYQIPFLPLIAALAAHSLLRGQALIQSETVRTWGILFVLAMVSAINVYFAETHYYSVNHLFVESGKYVQEATPEGEQVILSAPMVDPRSPFWMYRCRRTGWSVNSGQITPEVVERLRAEGAKHLAFLVKGGLPSAMGDYLTGKEKQVYEIKARKGFTLYVFPDY